MFHSAVWRLLFHYWKCCYSATWTSISLKQFETLVLTILIFLYICGKLGFNLGWCLGSSKWAFLDVRFWQFGKLRLYHLFKKVLVTTFRFLFKWIKIFLFCLYKQQQKTKTKQKNPKWSSQYLVFPCDLLQNFSSPTLYFLKALLLVLTISVYCSYESENVFCNFRISLVFWQGRKPHTIVKTFFKTCASVNRLWKEKKTVNLQVQKVCDRIVF